MDLIDIQECATDLNLSIPETQKLIDLQHRLIKRHDLNIQLHKKAETLKVACARFMDDTHTIISHVMEFPVEFFGTYENETLGIKLKPIHFCLFDIYQDLGKAFLEINPDEFLYKYEEVNTRIGDLDTRLLTTFGSGEMMRLLTEDIKKYDVVDGDTPKIHVILTVSTDDTTVGSWRKLCEKPCCLIEVIRLKQDAI